MSRRSPRLAARADSVGDIPEVGGREPCPCGSGRRYKACHGRARRIESARRVVRPFAGLPAEPDWVALREVVPAATAAFRLLPAHGGATVTVATVLPMAWPALHRANGQILVGLQTAGGGSGDPSRDVARALLAALDAEPGTPVEPFAEAGPGPRLQDLVDGDAGFSVTVHTGFDFWLEGVDEITPEVRESMERANAAVVPTQRLTAVEAAYWCRIGERRHLRWVLPQDEDDLLDALARLHAAGSTALVDGARYVGSFRAHGLLVPVWDLGPDTEADDVEEPAVAFAERLGEALAAAAPLNAAERRAREGVLSRQVTLR